MYFSNQNGKYVKDTIIGTLQKLLLLLRLSGAYSITVCHCFTITSTSLQFYLSFTSCKSWNYSIYEWPLKHFITNLVVWGLRPYPGQYDETFHIYSHFLEHEKTQLLLYNNLIRSISWIICKKQLINKAVYLKHCMWEYVCDSTQKTPNTIFLMFQ